MAYESLAKVYDKIMREDVDYGEWARYTDSLFCESGIRGNKILDLGCGTGGITLEMSKLGREMSGVDISEEMIAEAKKKFAAENIDVKLYQQDISALTIEEKFHGAMATFDTFNYLCDRAKLLSALKNIHAALEVGGVLVFDYNTRFKLADILGDNTYTYYSDETVYIWENEYNPNTQICKMQLTFFLRKQDDLYVRREEIHRQRAYSLAQWKKLLKESGFTFLHAYDQLSTEKVIKESFEEKIFVTAKKLGE